VKIKIILTLFFLFEVNLAISQSSNSPYPVIFVHGLNSDNTTWNTVISQLAGTWSVSDSNVLHFVINARGGDTTQYLPDVLFPLKDVSGNNVNLMSKSDIYAINFGNFWNRNPADPRILLYNNSTPGSSQSPSNQSAIYKQGFALKIMIDSVLKITGAKKVILLGHSMGGLAIREYLQRKENGIHKWWIDPYDTVNGHKVAKVITTGTPHLGTNVTSIPFVSIDNNSEAMRDMKITFSSSQYGAYLFGNIETNVPSNYYNQDVNCNGIQTDTIAGIDTLSNDNPEFALPGNIFYTWITSNYLGLGTDLAVPFNNQRLYINQNPAPLGVADTIRTNKNHIQQTSDTRSLIRGLDEPDKKDFAYEIFAGKNYSGFITLKSNTVVSDTDFYKTETGLAGEIIFKVNSSNAGVSTIALLSESGSLIQSKNFSGTSDSVMAVKESGKYLMRVTGNSSNNQNQNSYGFFVRFISSPALHLYVSLEGMWNGNYHVNDSLRIFLRENFSPYNKADSAIVVLDSTGSAVMQFTFSLNGNYYIQLLHRNALETWSSVPVSVSADNTASFDFTDSQSKAYGDNMIFKSGRWCLYSGDVNSDRVIDGTDANLIDNDAGSFITGYLSTDLNGDEIVEAYDAALAENNAANFINAVIP